jgi:hypothetical protein
MRYLEKEQVWLLPTDSAEEYEILVPGQSDAPSPSLLTFAHRTLGVLPELRLRALSHIAEFIRASVDTHQIQPQN